MRYFQIVKNLVKPLYIAIGSASLLVGCASDKGEPSLPTNELNTPGITIKLSLETDTPSYDELNVQAPLEGSEGEARAWNDTKGFPFKVVDANNIYSRNSYSDLNDGVARVKAKLARVDGATLLEENPTRDILVMIRKQGVEEYAYKQAQWRYNKDIEAYEIKGLDITLPASMGSSVSASDNYYARIITGAKYDEEKKTLEVEEHLTEMDFNQTSTLKAVVPFASDWVKLDIDAHNNLLVAINADTHTNRMKLKPLGSLVVFTFRNTGEQAVTFSKIRVLSNSLLFAGKYDLTQEVLSCQAPDNESEAVRGYKVYNVSQTGDIYREKEMSFNSDFTLQPNATGDMESYNSRIFVTWVAPVAGKVSVTGSLANTYRGAQTMVFAVEPKDGSGNIVHHPNYAISPIMGTNRLLSNGKAYAMNCEFYTAAPPLLGYYARYTVNATGNGFDTTHENSSVSLVHYKTAREFVGGKQLTNPATGQTNTYYMGNMGSARLLTLVFGIPFQGGGGYGADAIGSSVYRGRNQDTYPYLEANVVNGRVSYTPRDNGRWFGFMGTVPSNPYRGVAYYIVGRDLGSLSGVRRTNSQAFYRIEATGFSSGRIGSLKIRSFATGKYFVGGTYTPVYNGKNVTDESIWTDPDVLRGGYAERILPAAGRYNVIEKSDYERPVPVNTARTGVGVITPYWFNVGWAYNYMIAWAKGGALRSHSHVQSAGLAEDFSFGDTYVNAMSTEQMSYPDHQPQILLGYYSLNGSNHSQISISEDALKVGLWQALLPYSDTYQGDEADLPATGK